MEDNNGSMDKRKYIYLISGLPDISLEDDQLPFSAKYFLDDLENRITKGDFNLLGMLYYPRDFSGLLDILFKKNTGIQAEGCYSQAELERGLSGEALLPDFMNEFKAAFERNKNHYSEAEWETKLTELYFRSALNSGNEFLREWTEFELNLKNILLVLAGRKRELLFTEIVINANSVSEILKHNAAADLSMESSIDFMNEVGRIIDTDNIIERERKIDELKWRKIEEMSFFYYFTIETILSYCIKLMIIERWVKLLPGQGKALLQSIISSIIERVEIVKVEKSY